ncbi:MAG: formate C-acetyltransferase [Dethiobacter sp.]|jgi:formate C-acetyltransferase|nr:MAG: formate C-acetyltransferase [Dethiobacter sp.]
MNERIAKLKSNLQLESFPLCIEKFKLITQSLEETEGQPEILRRAKSLARVLDKITIFIEDGELIVGNAASKPMGLEIDHDYGPWSEEEIASLKDEGYTISAEEEAELKVLNSYYKGKSLVGRMGEVLYEDERLWPFMQSGVLFPPWKSREEGSGGGYAQGGLGLAPGFYLMGVDFAKVLNEGLQKIIAEAKEELKVLKFTSANAVKKCYFLKAVIIVLEAIIRFAHRFANLAKEMAAEEANSLRRKELERIAETCLRVLAYPARTFYEALQSFWFIFLLITPSPTAAAGRFDQYMYPFYKRDIEEGRLNDEEALELLQCLRIKDMQLNRISGKLNRQKNEGMAKWHNWTIGGLTPEAEDGTNELSYLILEAAKRCPTPHHTITVRVHEGTPEDFMLKALEVVKTGIGMPAFIGDKSYIEYFIRNGVPLQEARDYIVTGCLDANLPAQSRTASIAMFIVPRVFEITMHNGVDPHTGKQLGPRTGEVEQFTCFDEFMAAFKEQLAYFMRLNAERNNIELCAMKELLPDPVRSSLMSDAIKEGRDVLDRVMPFENGAVMNPVGMINVADSLAAVRKLVFEEKKITMKQLKEALAANWEGEYVEMRQMCLKAPKYGNDDDYVDLIARELYQYWAEVTGTFDTALGGKHLPTAISITAHGPGGALTGATPNGRFAGDVLADGTMSPMRGMDLNGPTAVIKSALKINQDPYQATLLNLKFHPSALKTTEDLRKLSCLIRTYFELGGKHLQFNVVDKETLLDAQKHPENHRDLIVRVAGYSAYFIKLGRAVQDEIIKRTEHQLTV